MTCQYEDFNIKVCHFYPVGRTEKKIAPYYRPKYCRKFSDVIFVMLLKFLLDERMVFKSRGSYGIFYGNIFFPFNDNLQNVMRDFQLKKNFYVFLFKCKLFTRKVYLEINTMLTKELYERFLF